MVITWDVLWCIIVNITKMALRILLNSFISWPYWKIYICPNKNRANAVLVYCYQFYNLYVLAKRNMNLRNFHLCQNIPWCLILYFHLSFRAFITNLMLCFRGQSKFVSNLSISFSFVLGRGPFHYGLRLASDWWRWKVLIYVKCCWRNNSSPIARL